MNTILVTGGAGFIGSHLIRRLLIEKFHVLAVDNFNNAYDPTFKDENIKGSLNNPNFKFIKGDITDRIFLQQVFNKNKINTIVHLAGRAGVRPSLTSPTLYYDTNIKGTYNILELMRIHHIEQIIFASSSSVYGELKPPFRESSLLKSPLSPYAVSKLSAEMGLYTYHKLYNIKPIILRFFSVFGPSGRPDMAPYLFTKSILEGKAITIFGKGNSARDWTYIDDIVEGIVSAIKRKFSFEIINLGGNKPIRLSKLIETIESILDKKAEKKYLPMLLTEVDKTWADIHKAQTLLLWKPKVSFDEGMKRFIDWYLEYRT